VVVADRRERHVRERLENVDRAGTLEGELGPHRRLVLDRDAGPLGPLRQAASFGELAALTTRR